ncbi:MAG: histidine phosphatase family protein [Burkholderiaceae bacterium]|jgi:phosphohistidine phosphatase|nr:histidine phosphatase family protein [Burkholderiaceae bacterium]
MDLILWRHAQAREAAGAMSDLQRPLTPQGERQAARMAAWLNRQLPERTRILASPALRAVQTADALGRPYRLHEGLCPGAAADDLLRLAGWPGARVPVLIVGHQPALGQAAAQLLGLPAGECAMRKGAVWWLRGHRRGGQPQTVLVAALAPEKL